MSAKLEAIFGPDLLAALDERVRAIVREAGDERLTVRQAAGKKDGDEELTVREVAEMKGVRPRTVYDWVKEKRIPCHRTPGGRLRFYRRHAERVLSESPRPS